MSSFLDSSFLSSNCLSVTTLSLIKTAFPITVNSEIAEIIIIILGKVLFSFFDLKNSRNPTKSANNIGINANVPNGKITNTNNYKNY